MTTESNAQDPKEEVKRGPGRPANKVEAVATPPVDGVLRTMEAFYKHIERQNYPGSQFEPCEVAEDIFTIITQAQNTPFIDYRNIKVYKEGTRTHFEKELKKTTAIALGTTNQGAGTPTVNQG
jgi:hypothetical protein